MAFLTALVMFTGIAGLSLVFLTVARNTSEDAARRGESLRLQAAATATADLVAQELWNQFVEWSGGEAGRLDQFRTFLESAASPLPSPLQPGATLLDDQNRDLGMTDNGAPVDATDLVAAGGASAWSGLVMEQVQLRRRDFPLATDLELTVTASTGDAAASRRRRVRQVFTIGGEIFAGFQYALLSNNVNCIMCHAEFDNVAHYYNDDPGARGSFDRVKVGTLESLMIRTRTAHSSIAGSLYVRGNLMDQHGNKLGGLVGTTLTGSQFDAHGHLVEDASGQLVDVPLHTAVGTPPPELGQLYLDYPLDEVDQRDGILPAAFPPPIPDLNGNRQVDADEFELIANTAHGHVSSGSISLIDHGGSFSGDLDSAGNSSVVSGSVDKHMLLVGTEANPLEIDGTLAVNGDLAITGVVRGDGAIYASGNVYILGDLVYDDASSGNHRTYGQQGNGTKNVLALASGGNIVVGNHLSEAGRYGTRGPVTGDGKNGFNFTMAEITLFNRGEWTKTQPKLPAQDGSMVDNPLYDPHHQPRYYVLGDNDPVFIFNGDGLDPSDRGRVYFDTSTNTWKGRELTLSYSDVWLERIDPSDPRYAAAAISPLAPDGGWLSEEKFQDLCDEAEDRHGSGAMEIDALLYTNNSAWTIARGESDYEGKLILNGALVAADTGVLVPGDGVDGLQLNFDSRVTEQLHVRDPSSPAVLSRSVWSPASMTQ